ncbi:hypothetical protein DL98DRAFT_569297 [Cadophora sp. DSE1049]|nr:hypothetical protein DL98DRAFT_569297 [Cadophora sp. DSE1049]
MRRNTPASSSKGTTAEPSPKSARLLRSDHEWDMYKNDIQKLYMYQDVSLPATMEVIESKYAFKRSIRKWKSKMREWGFLKHLTAKEMAFIVAKSDQRRADSTNPRDTIFVRGDIKITHNRIANFKKLKKAELMSSKLSVDTATPPNIRYFTPEPDPQEEDSTMDYGLLSEVSYRSSESTVNSDGSIQSDDQIPTSIHSLSMVDAQKYVNSRGPQHIPSAEIHIKAMIALADQLQVDGQFDEAESLYRRIIDEMKSDPSDTKWKAQCSLCKLLCRSQFCLVDQLDLAQLLVTNWAVTFKHSYSCENGSQLYKITLQLSCIDDTDNPSLQKVRLLACELLVPFGSFGTTWKFGSRDPNSEILFKAIELANGCSEVSWYDVADTLFSVLMGGSLAAFDRVGRKFEKLRAYIWYARHHQRKERWEDAVSTLYDAYRIITTTLLFSGNAVEYHILSSQLKSALNGISPAWRYSTSSTQLKELMEMDGQLDSILADDRDAKLGIPRLNCDSAGHSSSNAGRYGVTYSENGKSLNLHDSRISSDTFHIAINNHFVAVDQVLLHSRPFNDQRALLTSMSDDPQGYDQSGLRGESYLDGGSAPLKPPAKSSRLARNDEIWDMYKEEIRQMYVDRDMTLRSTVQSIETHYGFKASKRKWKMKIKEWNFEKNLPANEMSYITAKADKRKAEDDKDTIFVRGTIKILPERIRNFKKRKLTAADTAELPIIVEPCSEGLASIKEEIACIIAQDSPQVGTTDLPPRSVTSSPETTLAEQAALAQSQSPMPAPPADMSEQQPLPGTDRPLDRRVIPRSLDGPDILFSGDGIRKLVQGTPAMPVHLDSFLAILDRSPALSTCHQHISNQTPCLMYEGTIVERNTSFIEDHIRLAVQHAQNFPRKLSSNRCELIEQKGLQVGKDLLALQEHLRLASRDESRKLVAGAAAQYLQAILEYSRLYQYEPSFGPHLDAILMILSRSRVKYELADPIACCEKFFALGSRLDKINELTVTEVLDELLLLDEQRQLVENSGLFRSMVARIRLSPSFLHWDLPESSISEHMFGINLEQKTQFMGSLIDMISLNFLEQYYVDTGGALHDATINLCRFSMCQSSSFPVRLTTASQKLLHAFDIDDMHERHAAIVTHAVAIANFCSESRWDGTASTIFHALEARRFTVFDRVNRKVDKAWAYVACAQHYQRHKMWEKSIAAVERAFESMEVRDIFPLKVSGDYRKLMQVLQGKLELCPRPLNDASQWSVRRQELDKNFRRIIAKNKPNPSRRIRVVIDDSSTGCSSSASGKYGVTYTESLSSGMSGMSLNYSALFN